MRKVIAVFAGVAVAGLALAADVTTANTAVVVRKNPVESADGWQFLCVPVRGFDITGQGKGLGVPLNDVLPPADFPEGTELQIQGNSTGASLDAEGTSELAPDGVYTVVEPDGVKAWQVSASGTGSGEDLLKAGAFLWLKAGGATASALPAGLSFAFAANTADATETPVTTFCGEQNTLAEGETLVPADTPSGMKAYGNVTDTAVDVTAVCAGPLDGDEILRIKDGGKEYRYLEYWNRTAYTGWVYYGPTGIQELPDSGDVRTIAPGEAFYYYRRPSGQ